MCLTSSLNRQLKLILLAPLVLIGVTCFAQLKSTNLSKGNLTLANKIKDIKNADSATAYSNKLIAEARKGKDPIWEAQILYAQAFRSYCLGDISTAKIFASQSVSLTNPKDSATFIKAPLLVAYMLNRQGKDTEALKIAFDATRMAERYGWKILLIEAKICIADIYRSMNEPLKGLKYAQQAFDDAKSVKDTPTYIFAISTLSNLYSNRGLRSPENLEKAVKLYEIITKEPYLSTFSKFSRAKHLGNMGRLYEMQGKLALAENVLLQSVAISRTEKYKNLEAHALNELMTIKLDEAKYADAIIYGSRAVELLSGESNINTLHRNIYRNLTTAYLKLKNFEKAYHFNEQSRVINDSLVAKEKIEVATRLDEEYKADKRLIEANANARVMRQERNFIILISTIILIALIAAYRWFLFKKKKEEDLIIEKSLQAEKLTQLKAKFYTNISHELRTPLTLISGPIDQLQNDGFNLTIQEQKTYIETIWLNSKKLLNLLNELLDLSKLENGVIMPNLKPSNISEMINSIYKGFGPAAKYKNIRYELINPIMPDIIGLLDRDKIEKILNNLISNSLKFTPAGGIITVETFLDEGLLTILVSDSGKGIPAAELNHVFERYYQVSSDQSSAEGGTGIGLSIAKEFSELLNGSISVESTLGKGSLFIVTIPILIQTQQIHISSGTTILPISKPISPIRGNFENSILLVEDELEMANYISTILAPQYNLTFANNGKEAVQLLKEMEQIPSLIISDVMMPEMDGFAFLKLIKQDNIFCRIPVVMLTAITDDASKHKALNIGVDDYITKPFNSRELLARVNNLINNVSKRSNDIELDDKKVIITNKTVEISPIDLVWLKELETLIRKNTGKKELDIATISYSMAISERQLFRNIKRITGLTPNKYIRTVRLQIAREAIDSGKYKTLAEIAYITGFETPAYFSKLFKEFYGRDVHELLR